MYVMPLANSLRSITDNYAKLQQTAIPATTYRDEILPQNVKDRMFIGSAVISAMALVNKSVPAGATVVGILCKVIEYND